jgi:cytoskeletal protein RodZ
MRMPEYQAHQKAVGQGTQSAPEEVSKQESKARRRRGKRGVLLALVAFCVAIALALIWLRGTPDAPSNASAPLEPEARHEAIEDARPDQAQDARSALEETSAAGPAIQDAATMDAAASVPATPARSTRHRTRSQASKQPTEQEEQPELPTGWRDVPIGTGTPWDVPIERGEKQ